MLGLCLGQQLCQLALPLSKGQVYDGTSRSCAVSRQRQVVTLFLCATVETEGLTYPIRQHCNTEKIISMRSGCFFVEYL